LINDIDEALYYRKLRGVKKKMDELSEFINKYEDDSKELLKKIEVITEIENVQRLRIIKVKEKYRNTNDTYSHIRFKIEDFVPNIQKVFEDIDYRFVQLENYMNNQQFEEAKEFTEDISKDIDLLDMHLKDLPTYISVVRQYLPHRIQELKTTMNSMKEKDFSIERLDATLRMNKIENDLKNTCQEIKKLQLENVGSHIDVMTDDLNSLNQDLEKEETAFISYEKSRNSCYKTVQTIDRGLQEAVKTFQDIRKNYILDDCEITVDEDYQHFLKIIDELNELKDIIATKDFSYFEMIQNFEIINEKRKPFNDSLIRHNELAESLKIQEKRALDELDNINIVLLEIKSEIRNKHLPMISESYQDYIQDSYQKADAILNFIRRRPIDLTSLSHQVDAARDVIYKLYDNIHNLIVTAEMVEDAIVFGNRYRSSFLEVNTELTKAELLYRNGEYTKALATAVDIIEKIKPDSYEMLINKNSPKSK
ncbi:MAG: septation ring formation regulator EzrA, partial [Faecalibacillus sp.]